MSGEIQSDIADEYREARQEIESARSQELARAVIEKDPRVAGYFEHG